MNTESIDQAVTPEIIEQAYSYEEYTNLVQELFEEGRTTNEDNRENMLEHTKMAIQRSTRWNKRGKLEEDLAAELKEFPRNMIWLVLTEGWCGDASQILPFINKMAEASDHITLKLLLRDQHPEVMDRFLTGGSRSIPKLVALDADTLEAIGEWGPRPAVIQKRYMDMRADPAIENSKAAEELHLWYARDKGKTIQQEFLNKLKEWK